VAMAAEGWAAEWQAADSVREEQAEWQLVAVLGIAALLRAKTAQPAVSAAGVAAVRVRSLMWALAREIISRRLHTSMSDVAVILHDPVEISLA